MRRNYWNWPEGKILKILILGFPYQMMPELVTISGTVTDTAGLGIGQAEVTVLFSDGSFISQTPRLPVFTNLSGD